MECPSLSHLINVSLKSTLSKYCYSCLFWGTIGLVNLFPAYHPQSVLVSVNEMISSRQQIVGTSFLIQFAKQCLLMGEFILLTFSVSIDRYMVPVSGIWYLIPVILLSLLFKSLIVCS
jgi:hypothetical protein